MTADDCFCPLKNYSGSSQNVPLELLRKFTKRTTRMLAKQFKNSRKWIYLSKALDLYRQLISISSIFQQTTFFTHFWEHFSLAASDDLYYFSDFCFSFAKML